ncbi:CHAD domain-containing protein [Streptomyces thermoviolaceus subsp. thermoviolaceus]|uniref:CYTH and CHAD domain-containing protein n=1 Tax=Streptomyces thermoviolaceus subsp. thermoviolaceus TaxID=66860 RepID=A0ABX0YY98_STRTL|nr:CYTH and CHAD domain-containing protein [Streptomyces thermoviolaceus]NJP17073.1 CYTH and CHAD domain-containing protein [Streptomyces thermoviolaceus subsp. thermoviolaceus]GHB13273.1 CHAD domain-containing protein [Streptomyces thermoviolaceus subsp. thermoviolaceus]
MVAARREIERKYEAGAPGLPDLTGAGPVASVADRGTSALDAVYYDTADLRLSAAGLTLRRRTGGSDAGWHLKLPAGPGARDEIQAPLGDTVPADLAALVRCRVRDRAVRPLVRLRTERAVRHLLAADGTLLAEASVDTVQAERLADDTADETRTARWTEIEVELTDGADPAVLDQVEHRLEAAGVRRSTAASKLERALAETLPPEARPGRAAPEPPVTAGDHVLAHLRAQRDTLLALDPAVRRDLPDAVHRMRVATRRLRSVLRSYATVLDRAATRPVGAELKWLAGELGRGRDAEVLTERLTAALDGLPEDLVTGPVGERLRTWSAERAGAARRELLAALDGTRYLALLDALDAVVDRPPLRPAAAGRPARVLARVVRKEWRKLATALGDALALPPGPGRDVALHEARKQAKRARYAAEAAAPALDEAAGVASAAKGLQTLLGDHQDGVMARQALRELAAAAERAGESTFAYGLLYGREEQRAAEVETRLPAAWKELRKRTELPG